MRGSVCGCGCVGGCGCQREGEIGSLRCNFYSSQRLRGSTRVSKNAGRTQRG